jgi:hypothetical protein
MFWLIFLIWLAAVIIPAAIALTKQEGLRYLVIWEAIMFSPIVIIGGLIALLFIGSARQTVRNYRSESEAEYKKEPTIRRNNIRGMYIPRVSDDMYIPKVDRDFYLPRRRK